MRRDTSFISNQMWRNIIGQAVFQLAALAILQYMGKEILHLTDDNAGKLLNTVIFNTFVFCQVGISCLFLVSFIDYVTVLSQIHIDVGIPQVFSLDLI